MKSLVVYYSKSGNTKKVARAIAIGLGAELKNIEEIEDISSYELICIGTPVHAFAPSKPIKKFLKELPDLSDKKGAGFCTMHAFGGKRTLRIIKERLEVKGIQFLSGFSCKDINSIFSDTGSKNFNKEKPNEEDLKQAEDFGKKLLSEVEKF